jgi:hypothetical protein
MSLENIVANGSRLKRTSQQDWPAPLVGVARQLDEHLAEPASLRAVVVDLIEVARRFGCDAVAGASPIGERLAGAMVASGDELRLFTSAHPARCVLVVDGVVATGTQLSRAMRHALDAGAKHTPAVALMAEHDALASIRNQFHDEVIALREF